MMYDDFIDVTNEYEKNKELQKADVELLQEWVAKQPHLPKVSDLDLILYLHRCYYNIEATKRCIDKFYSFAPVCPEFFKNRNPSINTKITEVAMFVQLPKPRGESCHIILGKLICNNLDNFDLEEGLKTFDMINAVISYQTGTVPGHIILIDAGDLTYKHMLKFSLITTRKFFFYLQEIMPIRLKKIVFINTPRCFLEFMVLTKPFFSKEFRDKLHFYSDEYDELYKIIPKECFPSDYGGEAGSIEELTKKSHEMLLDHVEFFVEREKAIADESKTAGKPKDLQDIFMEEDAILRNVYVM